MTTFESERARKRFADAVTESAGCSCGETRSEAVFPDGHGRDGCEAEPTLAEVTAAVDAYVNTMDPKLRGGLMPEAVRQGMYPALIAAFSERAKSK